MSAEENIQNLYMEFQMLNNAIKQLEKQNQVLENQLMELVSTNQSLEDIQKVKEGTEILVPLSSGIYVQAELKDSSNFIVNIGSSIALNKDVNATRKIIEEQISEIGKMRENLAEELQSNVGKAASIESEMKKIASGIKEGE